MARRFPITTQTSGGSESGGLWRSIVPSSGLLGNFGAGANTSAYRLLSTSLFARTRYTLGILTKVIAPSLSYVNPAFGLNQIFSFGGTFPIISQRQHALGGDRSYFHSSINGFGANQNLPGVGGAITNNEGIGETEGLALNIMTVDDDAYPGNRWMINGRRQLASFVNSWAGGAGAGDALISRSNGSGMSEPFLGMFFHLDAMSLEEMIAMFMNVQRFRGIPDTDYTGFGVVPDHIWDVKRHMAVGSNGIASWVSDGAVGGETFTRDDTNQLVMEIPGDFASMR